MTDTTLRAALEETLTPYLRLYMLPMDIERLLDGVTARLSAYHGIAATPPTTLDAAWQAVEDALPEGATPSLAWSMDAWVASYQHIHTECVACGLIHQCQDEYIRAHGPTPRAALLALAERLRADR